MVRWALLCVYSWSALLAPSTWAADVEVAPTPQQVAAKPDYEVLKDFLVEQFGETLRTRDNGNCGVLFSPQGAKSRTDNSSAYKIADLSVDEFRVQLERMMEVAGSQPVRGDLAITGLPMWEKSSVDFVREARQAVKSLGLENQITILPMYRPSESGWKMIRDRATALLPLPQDFERPLPEEQTAMLAVLGSEFTTASYALSHFPPEVSAPMLTAHFGLLWTMNTYRRVLSNWNARSKNEFENLFKVGVVGGLFITNYNVTSRWPQAAHLIHQNGFSNFLLHNVPADIWWFAGTQGITTVAQTLFFWMTFTKGIWAWEQSLAKDETTSVQARRTASVLSPVIYWISAPVLAWASTSNAEVIQGIPLNGGQVSLLVMAAGGAVLWKFPGLLTAAIKPVEKYVYKPTAKIKDVLRNFFKKPPSEPPPPTP